MNEFNTEAKLENMDAVLDFVNQHLDGCSPKIQNQIGIVVDEVFSNIARYAYNCHRGSLPEIGAATVRVIVDDKITLEFEDNGAAYDPLAKEDPDISLSAEERDIGGLGIFMVKKIMDSVEYRREGKKNILTIKKSIT